MLLATKSCQEDLAEDLKHARNEAVKVLRPRTLTIGFHEVTYDS